jgi:hypothetical protein
MRSFIAGIFAAFIAAAGLGAIVWIVVPPRIDWGASNPPGAVEQALARNVLGRWIHRNAGTGTNPIVPTAENLKAARTEYEAHCAACHSLAMHKRPRPALSSRRPCANHVFCSLAALRSRAVILTVGRLKSSGQTTALTSASSFLPAFLMRRLRMVLHHSGD